MRQALTEAILDLLAAGRRAGGRRDHYGVDVENVSADGSEFDLVLTFKAKEQYCCPEFGCHFAYYSRDSCWAPLRGFLQARGVVNLPALTIRKATCIVEEGALYRPEDRPDRPPIASKADTYLKGPFSEANARTE
jgi:hypothetical protein